jgi:ketosteroid isomerase-like protein
MSTDLYPTAEPRFVGPAEDIEAIRQGHRDWWAGNHSKEMLRVSRNFAPDTLMFNLNGHTYYGLDEMAKVWEFYGDSIEIDIVQLWDYRIFVHGDLAYITCEGVFPTKQASADGWGASNIEIGGLDQVPVGVRFRETSIARRDDGKGNPVWKLWHFHCSLAAPEDEQRPGFGDTWLERGGPREGSIPQTVELPL